jgi:phage baseplate assembly protein W
MPGDFLGRGLAFPLDKSDEYGSADLPTNEAEAHIWQSITLILATARGERVMRPDFGCRIHDLVFAPYNATMAGVLADEVRLALARWEPRIDVLDIDTQLRGHENIVLINIHYRVRSTNNLFNLVYPFYLERGARP